MLALQRILTVNEGAGFEFVRTNANLREAMAHIYSGPGYKQWVFDVLDTWLVQEDELPPMILRPFEKARNISRQDALLLQDALEYRCDAFLTMETKLKSQRRFVQDVARLG